MAEHVSRLENPEPDLSRNKEINNLFPEGHLYRLQESSKPDTPWFTYFANYFRYSTKSCHIIKRRNYFQMSKTTYELRSLGDVSFTKKEEVFLSIVTQL